MPGQRNQIPPKVIALEDFKWGREDALVDYYSPDQRSPAYRRGYLQGLITKMNRTITEANIQAQLGNDKNADR